MTVVTIVLSIACFIVGGFASYLFFKHGLKNKYDGILRDAEAEAEVIKKNKLLEVKEKFLNKKADLEKEVAQRNQKIQQAENKLKQRELVLNQRQEEIQRKKMEAEAVKENLEAQLSIVDKKKEELEHMQRQEIEKLEAISGLSAEEAKERMVESLKEEAKTQALSVHPRSFHTGHPEYGLNCLPYFDSAYPQCQAPSVSFRSEADCRYIS